MTTAATITANLTLKSDDFKRGMESAAKATDDLKTRLGSLIIKLNQSSAAFQDLGKKMMDVGKKMTTFVTLPILGFFALIIKKALEADTALAKMANDSIAKLNGQLVELGTKFLPLVIQVVDKLTAALEWFNNAPPGLQQTITMFVAFLALAGPIVQFGAAISQIIGWIQGLRAAMVTLQLFTSTSLIPTIVSMGTAIWGALLPLLPIIALVLAAILLVYLVWKNWDTLKVTIQQLGDIIKFYLNKALDDLGKKAQQASEDIQKAAEKGADGWKRAWDNGTQIVAKLFVIAVKSIQATWTTAIAAMNAKITEFRTWATAAWNYIYSTFVSFFSGIANFASSVFESMIAGIQAVIDAVNGLIAALESIVLPAELTPGSPTPFELGLRGITSAMDELSRQAIPELNAAFAAPGGIADLGGGRVVNYTDNRRFAAGITKETLRLALDDRYERLTMALESA